MDVVLCAVAGLVALTAAWFEYPVTIGDRYIYVLPLREAAVILAVLFVWMRVAVDALQQIAIPRSPTDVRPPVGTRAVYGLVLISLLAVYAPSFPLHFATGVNYIDWVFDHPWRYFIPEHLWATVNVYAYGDPAYRPLSYVFLGVILNAFPAALTAIVAIFGVLAAVLVARLSFILWPDRPGTALLAGLFAGLWPQCVGLPFTQASVWMFLYMLGLTSFATGIQRESKWQIALACVCFVLGALMAEFVITMPLACALLAVALRGWSEHRSFTLKAVAALGALMILYVVGYAAYIAYCHAKGEPVRDSLVFPVNWKRMVLATLYTPLWSFLVPFEWSGTGLNSSGLEYLRAAFMILIVAIVVTRSWTDRGVRFAVASASIAVLPTANVFDMSTWGNVRWGLLSYELLCLPAAWVLATLAGATYRQKWQKATAIAAATAVLATVALLAHEQWQIWMDGGRATKEAARTIEQMQLQHPSIKRIDYVNFQPVCCGDLREAELRQQFPSMLHSGAGLQLAGVDQPHVEAVPSAHGTEEQRRIVYWDDSDLARSGSDDRSATERERILFWTHSRFVDVTDAVARGRTHAASTPLHVRAIRAGDGLTPEPDGSWIQRGRTGRLVVTLQPASPSLSDELTLRLTVTPLAVNAFPVANQVLLEWPLHETGGNVVKTMVPAVANGKQATYVIRLGTRTAWLMADAPGEIVVQLPRYPLRVRFDAGH
jgi:hypothetical protein